ncbi:MAG: saccharopine dehydrogenase NADP-binding domain-containing protein [Myxococcales bacterium]|nr:saccharopine dehydrogenase NADP-binding domain-containing protein [Myxococcales bacterium]
MILLYGAYGYTGALVARRAAATGVPLVLAGRNLAPLEVLAAELGYEARAFAVGDDPQAVRAALAGIRVVLNCAGPFSSTAVPLANHCLQAGVHYLDITGEIQVFEDLLRLDAPARSAGCTLLPGAGFDVVPSDCLARYVAGRLPGAHRLVLAFETSSRASRGTALTALGTSGAGWVRRDGALAKVPLAHRTIRVELGRGLRTAVGIPWGDVATAFYSTAIPNIETFVVLPFGARLALPAVRALALAPVRTFVAKRVRAARPGPSARQRARGWARLWAEASAPDGRRVCARLETPEPYEFTSWTALALALRAHEGALPPGFQTPSSAQGADYVLSFPDVRREDVPA